MVFQFILLVLLTIDRRHHVNSQDVLLKSIDDLPWPGELDCDKCERVYVPVCGFDGKTYINECRLYCTNEFRASEDRVYFKHYGPCLMIRRTANYLLVTSENSTVPQVMIDVNILKNNISNAKEANNTRTVTKTLDTRNMAKENNYSSILKNTANDITKLFGNFTILNGNSNIVANKSYREDYNNS